MSDLAIIGERLARLETQAEHLDECVDRLRGSIQWLTRTILGLVLAIVIDLIISARVLG